MTAGQKADVLRAATEPEGEDRTRLAGVPNHRTRRWAERWRGQDHLDTAKQVSLGRPTVTIWRHFHANEPNLDSRLETRAPRRFLYFRLEGLAVGPADALRYERKQQRHGAG